MYGEVQYGEIQYGSVGGNYAAYTSTLNDTVTPTDTIQKSITRTFATEIVTLSETLFDYVLGRGLAFMDTITGTEVFRRAFTNTKNDTATLTEIFSKAYGRYVAFMDAFSGLTDTITFSIGRFIIFLDTINLTEIYTGTLGKLFTDNYLLTEVFSTSKGYMRTLTDTFSGLTDSILRSITRNLTDTMTLTDVIRKYINGLLISVWSKVAKQTASWTKTAKQAASIWTKTEKPY